MPKKQRIIPNLWFDHGQVEEAAMFYLSVFDNAKIGDILRYPKGKEPDREGTIKHAGFTLEGQEFTAMDSGLPHDFAFNEAVSLLVTCTTREEVDYYWDRLTSGGEEGVCGWLKDRFGVSWQVAQGDTVE